MEIRKLTTITEEEMKNRAGFFDLGITSKKAAILLNYLLQSRINECPSKFGYYHAKRADSVRGGGLLVKAEGKITINDLNEVGIYFENHWSIGKFVRVASGKAEVLASIKDKLANELKKTWKCLNREQIFLRLDDHAKTSALTNEILDVEPNLIHSDESKGKTISITLNEYRALYEYLKGRDPEKIKERYGTSAYEMMVGKRVEDQFLLSAIDVIKNEIKNVEQECSEALKKAEDNFNIAYRELRTKKEKEIEQAKGIKLNKINELQAQMNELLKSTMGMVTQ